VDATVPDYIQTIPAPDQIRQDISRLFAALQAARKLLRLSEGIHDELADARSAEEDRRVS
jgi:hypothetical protein